jgi:hypothetical protein
MDTSDAKKMANRANAKRSTGPRSAAGKRRTRYNAVKHGLRGRTLVPKGEDAAEFEQLRVQLMRTFTAVTAPEQAVCTRIALAMWRGARAARAETATIVGGIVAAEGPDIMEADDPAAAALLGGFGQSASSNTVLLLSRYERSLMREARDGIMLLRDIQAARHAHVTGAACAEVGDILDGVDSRLRHARPGGTVSPVMPDGDATDEASEEEKKLLNDTDIVQAHITPEGGVIDTPLLRAACQRLQDWADKL